MGSLYNQDIVLWSQEQSAALRRAAAARPNLPIDWENVAEEIESLGKSQRLALASQILRILEHLMKLQASPSELPRGNWISSIVDAQGEIDNLLEASPSLRREVASIVARQLPKARRAARAKLLSHKEAPLVDLETLSFSEEQVLDWHPDV